MRQAGRNTDERDKYKGIAIDIFHTGWPTEGQEEREKDESRHVTIER